MGREIRFIPLALAPVVMKCTNVNTSEVILIRAYGKKSELIIDRVSELAVLARPPSAKCVTN